ncbi:hypothetical protein LNV08_04855 [Paucibacter sp. TC2R-5]|uniref:hypothetical protein n=1 Tax=Paucibacter sp. TC2R-5 TaxID=2893555 RepID=UPI0021E43BB4|nr:hypothetical protein [Paucibacter sp. TC2R-5]MCV2358298.1 hypothetical protein [Paucibacter sp. TC2R-5]
MNTSLFQAAGRARIRQACVVVCCSLAATWALAGPGAHGPNGEHLDQAPSAGATLAAGPRVEAQTDLFELVARLGAADLTLMIDRFASNEPVLKAEVEVESGALKAKAKFQADSGAYVLSDPALLKLLATPGEHPLLITIVAGAETDLLDGVLRTSAADAAGLDHDAEFGHGESRFPAWARWLGGGVLLLALLLAPRGWVRVRKARKLGMNSGAQT